MVSNPTIYLFSTSSIRSWNSRKCSFCGIQNYCFLLVFSGCYMRHKVDAFSFFFLSILFSKTWSISSFLLNTFPAYNFGACKCNLSQEQAGTQKHRKVSSTEIFGTQKTKIFEENSWHPLLCKKFFDTRNSQKRTVLPWIFLLLSFEKIPKKNHGYPRYAEVSIPKLFQKNNTAPSRIIS